jgi:carbon-monoxide dehydrogenase large subunit
MAQGLGEALMERVVYDASGQLVTGSLMDYAIPRASDMPPITLQTVPTKSPANRLGVKGAGEAGCIGVPAAVLNAAIDALAPLGVRHLQMPLTNESIWQAIRNRESETVDEI